MEHRSGKHQQSAPDLGELDAIVVNIFDSLDGPGAPRPGRAPGQPAQTAPAAARRGPGTAPKPTSEPEGPAPASADPPLPDESAGGEDADEGGSDPSFLLDGEEERFVERTVAWLAGRPNPDILLDRIWSRLIELTEEEARLASHGDEPEPADEAGPQDLS